METQEEIEHTVYPMLQANQRAEWWSEIHDAQKISIARGIKDMENGNTIPQEEMLKFYSKWLTK